MYSIPCNHGLKYVGKTKGSLETHHKERQTATRQGEMNKLAIAKHAWEEQHQPIWDKIKITDHTGNENILIITEALHITMTEQFNTHSLTDNKDCNCWRPLLKQALYQGQHNHTLKPHPPT